GRHHAPLPGIPVDAYDILRSTMVRGMLFTVVVAFSTARAQDWPAYAGDPGSTHYSALDQINRGNVANLKQLWEWKTGEEPLAEFKTTPGMFEGTPLKIGNRLY